MQVKTKFWLQNWVDWAGSDGVAHELAKRAKGIEGCSYGLMFVPRCVLPFVWLSSGHN